jgi:hypothetical protein
MSNGIIPDGAVGARGHGKSLAFVLAPAMSEFALAFVFEFVLSVLALVVPSDQTSSQSCITRGGKKDKK